ncbi:MAG: DUF4350 domain-containing protein [Cyclobacteriaceae bacterium]|nr:DUF4350 domain-containing protein [Cyclobacteriaceae bacterium]
MKKDWKYIVYLSAFIGIYVVVQLLSPKQHNWSISLSHADKDPYGTYVLNELLPDLFDSVETTNKTLYELLKNKAENTSLLSLSTSLNMAKEDTESLLQFVANGNTVFLSSHYFGGKLADTLNLDTNDSLFSGSGIMGQDDSVALHFSSSSFDTLVSYKYRRDNAHNYFNTFDSLRTTIIGRNDSGEPVTLLIAVGKGSLIVNSTPLAFTNINILHSENHNFVSSSLSYLNKQKLVWTEFYHLGRMEAGTPLRFILTQEPLAWAYYIAIGSILLLILFESKRKQRIIPIIPPVENTTLEFVSTIGNLYYHRGDHKNIAEKKIVFLFDTLRSRYHLDIALIDDIKYVARKTGNDESSTSILFDHIQSIQKKREILPEELITLNKQIEDFIKK